MANLNPLALTDEEIQRIRLQQVWNSLHGLQYEQGDGKTTDVHLICSDGLVPAHTGVLANVSPILKAVFFSQGEDYPGYRSVLLPEHRTSEIARMVQLIYTGSVNVADEGDCENLKKVLLEFQVLNMDKLQFVLRTRPAPKHILYFELNEDLDKKLKEEQLLAQQARNGIGNKVFGASESTASTATVPPQPSVLNSESNEKNSASIRAIPNSPGEEMIISDDDSDIMIVEVLTNPNPRPVVDVVDVDLEMKREPQDEPIPDENSSEDSVASNHMEVETSTAGSKLQQTSTAVLEHRKSQAVEASPASATKSDSESEASLKSIQKKRRPGPKSRKNKNGSLSPTVNTPGKVQVGDQEPENDDTEEEPSVNVRKPGSGLRNRANANPSLATVKRISSSSNDSGDSVSTHVIPTNVGTAPGTSSAKKLIPQNKPGPASKKSLTPGSKTGVSKQPDSTGLENNASKDPGSANSPNRPTRSLRSRENRKRVISSSSDDLSGSESDTGTKRLSRPRRSRSFRNNKNNQTRNSTGRTNEARKPGPQKRLSSPIAVNAAPTEERQGPSNSDSENDGMDKSFYKDPKRIWEESKVCRGCNKKYDSPKDASDCVTETHKLVRCYFCFRTCENTELLFEHYSKDHRKAGREGHLICPYCSNSVPHRSVSTHVISYHIFANNSAASATPSPGSSKSAAPAPKKRSLGGMQLLREEKAGHAESEPDDDEHISTGLVMKKKSNDGNVRVFILDKDKNKK